MKDLKHYFGVSDMKSDSTSELSSAFAKRKSVVGCDEEDSLDLTLSLDSDDEERPKKKKRKKRRASSKLTLRGNTGEDVKSDSSKENSLAENAMVENVLVSDSPSTVTPPSKNLFNYFARVDKHLTTASPSHVTKIHVEALVHRSPTPPLEQRTAATPTEVKRGRGRPPLRTKFRRRHCEENPGESTTMNIEYDVVAVNDIKCVEIRDESDEDVVIVQEEKFDSLPIQMKRDGTLSSFFQITSSKAKVNEILNGRKCEFLRSGAPESINKLMNAKIRVADLEEPSFPAINHVLQKDKMNIIWNLSPWTVPVSNKLDSPTLFKDQTFSWSSKRITSEDDKTKDEPSKVCPIDKKRALKSLKKELKQHPVERWFKGFNHSDESDLWTDKYRPRSADSIVGNVGQVNKLRKWLVDRKETVKRSDDDESGSDVEFLETSHDERPSIAKNAILLSGPCGVGKTASVYALAEEIGYEVLELNATCVRTGKKILHEFSEAMQSHKVQANTFNFSGKIEKDAEKDKKCNLILIEDVTYRPLGRRTKSTPEIEKTTSETVPVGMEQLAELLFLDQDEGYQNTIATLAATSKRPVVFTTNETSPKSLTKITQSLSQELKFKLVDSRTHAAWLRTVAIAEGVHISPDQVDQIVHWAQGDVRKSLIQMQYNGRLSIQRTEDDVEAWQSLNDNNFDGKYELSKRLDLLSLTDVIKIMATQDPCQRYWDTPPKESTILTPPIHADSSTSLLSLERGILKCVAENRETRLCDRLGTTDTSVTYHAIVDRLTPASVLSRKSVGCDYLPALRQMARSERLKLASQTKRNKRQMNYLQQYLDLDLPQPDETLSFLCESLAH